MRHLLQQSSSSSAAAEHLTAVAAAVAATPPPASSSGVHTDTFLILAAVLCFLFCVVGLAFVARCWRLCNPSAYSVNAEPEATMPCNSKGLKKKALQALPTVSFEVSDDGGGKAGDEECAICLAEFARGDAVRVLPPCGHRFHVACVDVWLVSSSTCPSCRRALVVVMPPMALVTATATSLAPTCCVTAAAQASTAERPVAGGRGPCRPSSVP